MAVVLCSWANQIPWETASHLLPGEENSYLEAFWQLCGEESGALLIQYVNFHFGHLFFTCPEFIYYILSRDQISDFYQKEGEGEVVKGM